MNKVFLIYLRKETSNMILSKTQFNNVNDLIKEFPDYMSSLQFTSLSNLEDFLRIEYSLTEEKLQKVKQFYLSTEQDNILVL